MGTTFPPPPKTTPISMRTKFEDFLNSQCEMFTSQTSQSSFRSQKLSVKLPFFYLPTKRARASIKFTTHHQRLIGGQTEFAAPSPRIYWVRIPHALCFLQYSVDKTGTRWFLLWQPASYVMPAVGLRKSEDMESKFIDHALASAEREKKDAGFAIFGPWEEL